MAGVAIRYPDALELSVLRAIAIQAVEEARKSGHFQGGFHGYAVESSSRVYRGKRRMRMTRVEIRDGKNLLDQADWVERL